MSGFTNQVAVVTGGSSGIGKAIALELARTLKVINALSLPGRIARDCKSLSES